MVYNKIKEEFIMDKILTKVLNFILFIIAPCVLGWSFMSYHNYSMFGVSIGIFLSLCAFGITCTGLKDK